MSLVRAGIVVALPLAVRADRVGRQRVMRAVAWAAPIVCALSAIAPSFPLLVLTQSIGRPLGLDYAYGFDRLDRNGRPAPKWQLHFRLGQLF